MKFASVWVDVAPGRYGFGEASSAILSPEVLIAGVCQAFWQAPIYGE